MNIDVQTLIEIYNQEIDKLVRENITLKAQLLQIEKEKTKVTEYKEGDE